MDTQLRNALTHRLNVFPIKPRSNRLILATITPYRLILQPLSQAVNSGKGRIENIGQV
jgi:hypothetical protein